MFPIGHSGHPSLTLEPSVDLSSLLIQAVAGAVGGNLGGLLNKAKSLGPMVNTILGLIGGVGGGQLLSGTFTNVLGNATAGTATASGIVGILLPLIAGMLKKKPTAACGGRDQRVGAGGVSAGGPLSFPPPHPAHARIRRHRPTSRRSARR